QDLLRQRPALLSPQCPDAGGKLLRPLLGGRVEGPDQYPRRVGGQHDFGALDIQRFHGWEVVARSRRTTASTFCPRHISDLWEGFIGAVHPKSSPEPIPLRPPPDQILASARDRAPQPH